MFELKPLSQILNDIDSFSWACALYLPLDRPWTLQTLGVVSDPDVLTDAADSVVVDGCVLGYALTVQQIQDVKASALAQRPDLSLQQLFRAFIYYCSRDAFLDFSKHDG